MDDQRLIQHPALEGTIRRLRGQNIMLDVDLALLYGVSTKALLQAVKRNPLRFPIDFMFQLTASEVAILRSQIVTSRSWGGRRYRPYAFTEHGVAMLSSVIRSQRAARTNVEIMRVFIRLRRIVESQTELSKKLDALEKKYDSQFADVFRAIRDLMALPTSAKRQIGFRNRSPW
jgi:hypothetical protein